MQRNITDERPIQCNDESNETTQPVHAKIIANRDTLTNFENNDTIINEFNDDSCVFVNELSSLKYIGVAICVIITMNLYDQSMLSVTVGLKCV